MCTPVANQTQCTYGERVALASDTSELPLVQKFCVRMESRSVPFKLLLGRKPQSPDLILNSMDGIWYTCMSDMPPMQNRKVSRPKSRKP